MRDSEIEREKGREKEDRETNGGNSEGMRQRESE